MALKDDLRTQVKSTFEEAWTTRDGTVVPGTNDIKLKNDGVNLDATVIYADLSESTAMVDKKSRPSLPKSTKTISTALDG